MNIEDFADAHGLEIEIHQRLRKPGAVDRYYAHFRNSYVFDPWIAGGIIGEHGNGSTPNSAIADYAMRISGRIILVGYMTDNQREVDVPQLEYGEVEPDSEDERTCSTCRHYDAERFESVQNGLTQRLLVQCDRNCRRFPESHMKEPHDYCGEYSQMEDSSGHQDADGR